MSDDDEFEYELWQDGIMVAAVTCAKRDDAEREIRHYGAMYRQDGPCEIRGPIGPYCKTIQL